MKKTILLFAALAFLTFKNQAQTTVTDIDGNVYDTVHIGSQVWLKQNLKTTKYSDGTVIPNVKDVTTWSGLKTGAYCDFLNYSFLGTTYGHLYNGYAVSPIMNGGKNLCPSGWHVPSDSEWNIMEKYLDNTVDTTIADNSGKDIGDKLKEAGSMHWGAGSSRANNSSKFTALPGGVRFDNATDYNMLSYGYWWTYTAYGSISAWYRELSYSNSSILRYTYNMKGGMSCRCVMNTLVTRIPEIKNNYNIQIYPNPAIDKVYIEYAERKDFKIQVYNMIGECVSHVGLNSGTNEIDIRSLPKGIYIIRIIGDDWTVQRKMIKE